MFNVFVRMKNLKAVMGKDNDDKESKETKEVWEFQSVSEVDFVLVVHSKCCAYSHHRL